MKSVTITYESAGGTMVETFTEDGPEEIDSDLEGIIITLDDVTRLIPWGRIWELIKRG